MPEAQLSLLEVAIQALSTGFALLETLCHHTFKLTYFQPKVNELIDQDQMLRFTYSQSLALEPFGQLAVG